MIRKKEVILGSSPEHPLRSNTVKTPYTASNDTRLIILNAENPAAVSITSTVVDGRTILSILPPDKKDSGE